MRKIKFTLLLIIGLILFSCQSKFDLKSDKHLTEIFSNNELVEIEKIINYVDNRVVELTGSRDINEAYHKLFDKLLHPIQDGSTYSYLVPFEEEEKYEFLQNLDSTVFSEFWTIGRVRKAVYQDSIYENGYQFLELSSSGRYVADYLQKIGEEDAYYKSEKETIIMAGGLSPTIVAWFLKNHNGFDFTIPKHRLWATVFILRIEEPHDKKMERYLKQKNIKQ